MLELHSHHSVGGGLHEGTFTIRNSGAREFQVRLPATAHDCRLLNDQAEEQVIATSPASGEMTVPLDPLRQLSVVRIRYSSTAQPSRHWPITRIVTPIPQPSLPVLGRQWAVSLAPGLALPRPAGDWPIQRLRRTAQRRRPLQIARIGRLFLHSLVRLQGPRLRCARPFFRAAW